MDNIVKEKIDKLKGNEWTQVKLGEDYETLAKEYKNDIDNLKIQHAEMLIEKSNEEKEYEAEIKKLEARITELESNKEIDILNSKIVELETLNLELQNELDSYTLSKDNEEFEDKVQKVILSNIYDDLGATRKMINAYLKENK